MSDAAPEQVVTSGRGRATFGLRLASLGAITLFFQLVLRFMQGSWTQFGAIDILHALGTQHPEAPWPGAQNIVDAFLGMPLGIWLLLIGIALAWNGARAAEAAQRTLNGEDGPGWMNTRS